MGWGGRGVGREKKFLFLDRSRSTRLPSPPLFLPPSSAAFNALKAAYHPEVAPDAASTLEECKRKMPAMTVMQLKELIAYKVPGAADVLDAKQEKHSNYNVNRRTYAG